MTRLPQPGKDSGTWGDILNDYLSQSHKTDGSLKDNTVGTSQLKDNSVGAAQLQAASVGASQLQDNAVGPSQLATNAVTASAIADSTITSSQLATDITDKLDKANTALQPGDATTTATPDKLVKRTSDGRIKAATATESDDVVSLGQGDGRYTTTAEVASQIADPNSELGAALSSTYVAKGDLMVDIRDYGAEGDGTTDDTLAIRAAIAATPTGGTLLIPPTTAFWRVTQQAEAYIFLIDRAITIRGEGGLSAIGVDTGVTATTDVFLIAPTPDPINGTTRGLCFDNFKVISSAEPARPGRHAIHVDLTATGSALSNSTFTRLDLRPLGGKSFKLTNPTSTTGMFATQIQKNLIWAGIELARGGDSLTVTENVIAGYNSVDVVLINGSSTFVFAFNNVTCRGGMRIGSGHNMKVLFNNFEAGYADATGSHGALLDLDGVEVGQSWGLLATEVRGNNFTFRSSVPDGTIDAIRVNDARSAVIETNHIAHKASRHIVITSSADETIIGYNLFSSVDPFGIISDSGVRTIRKDTVRLAPTSGAREMYEAEAAVLRYRANELIEHIDKVTHKPIISAGAPVLEYEWNVANTFVSKFVLQTRKRNADNTTDTAVPFARIADGYMYFTDGGFALMDSAGFRWKVTITTGGVLTTTRM